MREPPSAAKAGMYGGEAAHHTGYAWHQRREE